MSKKIKHESFKIERGSGNVFRDLGFPNPDSEQVKATLVALIIRVLNERKLSVRAAAKLADFADADFSRIRGLKYGRFTIDRLMLMLDRLGQEVKISVKVHPRAKDEHNAGLPV